MRQYGVEYPERDLMSDISNLLGIPHFSTSNGATVRRDFLVAVAGALGLVVSQEATKDELIREIWQFVNGAEMPEDRLSRGGTVTNLVLQEIADGIKRCGLGSAASE